MRSCLLWRFCLLHAQADDASFKALLGMVVELQVWEEARDVVKAQVGPCPRSIHGGGAASVGGGARRHQGPGETLP